MKLKKKTKIALIISVILIVLITIGIILITNKQKTKEEVETVKVINKVDKYGYQLKETKSKRYNWYKNSINLIFFKR